MSKSTIGFAFGLYMSVVGSAYADYSAEGIVRHGCDNGKPEVLENTTDKAVRIQQVFQSAGERTISITRLEPGAKIEISAHLAVYIRNLEGGVIGFFVRCN